MLILRAADGSIVGAMPKASVCMYKSLELPNVAYLTTDGTNRHYPERSYVVKPENVLEPAGSWNVNSLLLWLAQELSAPEAIKSFKSFASSYGSTQTTLPIVRQLYAMQAVKLNAGSASEVYLKTSSIACFTNDALAWYLVSGATVTGLLNSHFAAVSGSQVLAAKLGAAFPVTALGLVRAAGYASKNSVSSILNDISIKLSNAGTNSDVFALVVESYGSKASVASTINWIETP